MTDKPPETDSAQNVSPTEARQAEKRGLNRTLVFSLALAVILLVAAFGLFAR